MNDRNFDPEDHFSYAQPLHQNRTLLSEIFIKGDGIEIGALCVPVFVDKSKGNVKYLDKFSAKELLEFYPEITYLKNKIIEPDIIDDAEHLYSIKNESQDFVIANHFLEHTENVFGCLENLFRIIKKNGILYMAIPDKRYTFDKNRERTKLEHIVDEYKLCSYSENRENHYLDSTLGNKESAMELMEKDYSIHFHIWEKEDLEDLLIFAIKNLGFKFTIENISDNYIENLCILRKEDTFLNEIEFNELYNEGILAIKNKNYVKSEFIFSRLVLYNENIELKYFLAISKYENKKFEEALDLFIDVIDKNESLLELYKYIAICLEKIGDTETSELYYEKHNNIIKN